ncbi:MAG: hypothetical protein WAK17_10635 [Candidatus Nitrosopolaris sp.]
MNLLASFDWLQNKFLIPSSKGSLIANFATTAILVGLILTANSCSIPKVLSQDMMMPLAASIGDRKIVSLRQK